MPTYPYHCKNDHYFERILPVADYKTPQKCDCGADGRRIITAPMLKISPDVCYDSPIDGRPITTMAKRREDLARNHCQPYDPEMKKDAERFRKDSEDRLERAVDATVEEAIEKMPSKKKERLTNELLGGAEATPQNRTPNMKPIVTQLPQPLVRTKT